jgi:uncharacterized protein
MPRPFRNRMISYEGDFFHFVPRGIRNFKENLLSVDEFEAVRLIDLEEVDQKKAAEKMEISQPTLSRILKSARKKISDAVINGKSIKISGGKYKMVLSEESDFKQGNGRGLGLGLRGRMQGFSKGPGGICKCPNCGQEFPQIRGQPCNKRKCLKCGSFMVRK